MTELSVSVKLAGLRVTKDRMVGNGGIMDDQSLTGLWVAVSSRVYE